MADVLAAPSDLGEHISQPIPTVFEPVLPRLIDRGGSGLYAREERLVAGDVLHLVADRVLPTRRDPYRNSARSGAEAAWCVDTRRGAHAPSGAG